MQADYGKDIETAKPRQNIDEVLADSIRHTNRLIAVALAANDIIDCAQKDKQDRYYFRVPTKRFNAIRRTLKALAKLQQ
ncbi:MAG: hypothetical protein JXB29_11030 [Sedimentisphaerales bacterium]|nr:hypothetical protein [Sedimentisphaerales bacterium]